MISVVYTLNKITYTFFIFIKKEVGYSPKKAKRKPESQKKKKERGQTYLDGGGDSSVFLPNPLIIM